jgi:uncharacterized OsmC-like protein
MSDPSMQATLEWTTGLRFNAAAGENKLILDGDRRDGCSPMETLMLALAGCMAIDVVDILGKMRTSLRAVRAQINGTRADSRPGASRGSNFTSKSPAAASMRRRPSARLRSHAKSTARCGTRFVKTSS